MQCFFYSAITIRYKEYIGVSEKIAKSGDGELLKWSMRTLQDSRFPVDLILPDARHHFYGMLGNLRSLIFLFICQCSSGHIIIDSYLSRTLKKHCRHYQEIYKCNSKGLHNYSLLTDRLVMELSDFQPSNMHESTVSFSVQSAMYDGSLC